MIEIQETITVTITCPKCGGKAERRIAKEKQQKDKTVWYVENCSQCPYWGCGFIES